VTNQQNQNIGLRVSYFEVGVDVVDASPPVVTMEITGTLNEATGWYNDDEVIVDFDYYDDESGIDVDSTDCDDVTISTDTDSPGQLISCTVFNGSGLSTTIEDFYILKDSTPPEITESTIPTFVTDEIDQYITLDDFLDPCQFFRCQADSEDGSNISYTIPSATDASPGSGTDGVVVCTKVEGGVEDTIESSGTTFDISTSTTVNCNISDIAGNDAVTQSFSVNVTPYLEWDSDEVSIGLSGTLTASDPSQTGAGSVLAKVTSPTGLFNGQSLTAELTEGEPGVFSANISFQDNLDTNDENLILLAGNEDLVTATYPFTDHTSTAKTTATVGAFGIDVLLSDVDPVRFSSDIFAIGTSGNLAHIVTGDDCTNNFDAGSPDSVTADIFDLTVDPTNTSGISVTLNENSNNSCIFELDNLVKFSTGGNIEVGEGAPQLNTDKFRNVRAEITSGPGIGQTTTILIWAPPSFNPSSGIAVATTAANCGNHGGDADLDGICDDWEQGDAGLVIPDPDGGDAIYNYPCTTLITDPFRTITDNRNSVQCPTPDKKDIFIEMDYMTGHKPFSESLLQLVDAFQNAPVDADGDGTNEGINLHIQVDDHYGFHQQVLEFEECDSVNTCDTSYRDLKEQFWGTADDRNDDDAAEILAAKRQAFRYMAMIHQQESNPTSSGYAEIRGNDIITSLGLFTAGVGSIDQQTGTMMHEIGHSINLNHGGAAANTQGCKPNYISVMNYAFQFSSLVDRNLDFSRETLGAQAANTPNNSLDETKHQTTPWTKQILMNP
jgi:hypothetical protein